MNRADFLKLSAAAGLALAARRPDAVRQPVAGENLQHFVSQPTLKPPTLAARGRTRDHVFLAPSSGPGQRGVMIIDGGGELVWFHPTGSVSAMDFKVQQYRGRPVLTWWEGKSPGGIPTGEWVIVDAAYGEVARFRAARGRNSDLHEFVISPESTALVTATRIAGNVVEGIVQELELPSGSLIREWRSLEHVPVSETAIRAKPGPRFDYFHVNSIDVGADGNLVISARNTWAAYCLERETGRVLWRLGGKKSDFVLEPGARFYWQHDVRRHPGDVVSVFDNGAAPAEEKQSRALLLHLDHRRKRAALERSYTHKPEVVLSHFMGNAQLEPDGRVFVGWGGSPYVTEFTPTGEIVFDAALPRGGQTYRAFRSQWSGRPTSAPAVAAAGGALYASWNGATGVASWRLVEDDRETVTVPRSGFETVLRPSASTKRAAAIALDARGTALARSAPVDL